ncbi:type IV secretion system protein [Pseudomonas sp. LPH60]|uniref:virB8 family protein n=1 Tax=Pseudomonas sp. LPH60 TaxID=3065906 RepID=UPI00273B7072|nr:type IV secretion system protein [Pseudomonas sp. LPH60]MDP4573446.1 type IV secretion system protein [Pseudomonas sp. LPH60]
MLSKDKGQHAPNHLDAKAPSFFGGITKSVIETANDWEASRIESIEKSERRAWMVAAGFGACLILSVVALALLTPLKENTPYVLRVDNTTGIADIVTAMDEKDVGYNEVMDKFWMAQYVRARETYDWYSIQNDYNMVGLLSSQSVGAEYAALFEGKDALDKKYGSSVRATIKIISVTPNGRGTGTVRFIKTTKRVDDSGPGTSIKYIATVSYEYRNPSRLYESQRLINPFGWQARTYRVDPELPGGEG